MASAALAATAAVVLTIRVRRFDRRQPGYRGAHLEHRALQLGAVSLAVVGAFVHADRVSARRATRTGVLLIGRSNF